MIHPRENDHPKNSRSLTTINLESLILTVAYLRKLLPPLPPGNDYFMWPYVTVTHTITRPPADVTLSRARLFFSRPNCTPHSEKVTFSLPNERKVHTSYRRVVAKCVLCQTFLIGSMLSSRRLPAMTLRTTFGHNLSGHAISRSTSFRANTACPIRSPVYRLTAHTTSPMPIENFRSKPWAHVRLRSGSTKPSTW